MVCPFDPVERMASIDREEQNLDPNPQMDLMNKPPHYNAAGIECIDAMEAMVEDANLPAHQAYCWQSSFKYLWRWSRKNKNGLEDL